MVFARKHIVHPTSYGAFSSTCIYWDEKKYQRHGSELFSTLSVLVINSLYKQLIKYGICGEVVFDVVIIIYNDCVIAMFSRSRQN